MKYMISYISRLTVSTIQPTYNTHIRPSITTCITVSRTTNHYMILTSHSKSIRSISALSTVVLGSIISISDTSVSPSSSSPSYSSELSSANIETSTALTIIVGCNSLGKIKEYIYTRYIYV